MTLPEASAGPPADPGARLESRKGKRRASFGVSHYHTKEKGSEVFLAGNKMKQTNPQNINKDIRMFQKGLNSELPAMGWFSFFLQEMSECLGKILSSL